MTLDRELDVPEYTVKLYYHSSRPPSEETVKKICESLQLAREISDETATALADVLNDAEKDDPLAREVAEYHFKVNARSPKNLRDKVINVMSKTAEGLKKDSTTLSDVLNRYRCDLYKFYEGLPLDQAREELRGAYREFESNETNRPAEEEARSGYLPFNERHMEADSGAQFSPDGQRVVTVSEMGRAQVWDAVTGHAIGTPMDAPEAVRSAWFSPDGRRVVTTSRAGTARVWNVETGEGIGEPMQHEKEVYSAQFSSDGQRVVTASADNTARVWNAETGEEVGKPMPHEGEVYAAQFSPDGQSVVTASSDGSVRVWNVKIGQGLGKPMRHTGPVYSVQFSPGGERVVTASADKTARVWHVETQQAIGEAMQHEGAVRRAQFSPDGQRVVTASEDETARIWNAETGKAVVKLHHEEMVYSARFTSDGKKVVTVIESRKQQVWNAETGELLSERVGPEWLREAKGIHIEFSEAEVYPRYFLALCIVHEATHKFARTEDHAYTDDKDKKYENLKVEQRIENADCFAYATISIGVDKLIKDLREFLTKVPQHNRTGPGKASAWPNGVLSRARKRGIDSGTR